MSKINELKSYGFTINWTLLYIGYQGYSFIPILLNKEEILDYALQLLESTDSDYELIAQLIAIYQNDYEFLEIFNLLTKSENIDFNLQVKKWIVYLVNKALEIVPADYFEGLIYLTDLWVSLGLPDNCPHIIQGRYNSYSIQEYYTQDMYNTMIKKNEDWVYEEINTIQQQEKDNYI